MRWILLLLFGALACGDAETRSPIDASMGVDGTVSADAREGDGGEIPICADPPMEGADCLGEQRCQTAGSPCGSIWNCRLGVWASQVVCPPRQMCPTAIPSDGESCGLDNPPAGPLRCTYDDACPAGEVQVVVCNGQDWSFDGTQACPGS